MRFSKQILHTLGALLLLTGIASGTGCVHSTDVQTTDASANAAAAQAPWYKERHRPTFHFTPPANWMNDPNGMFYYEGEYHLFYQYYPDDTVWGPMHWAHAISTDLVHWQHLPVALFPDELGYIFSGSAVVDWHNSSGFGVDGKPPIVAIFTYHNPELADKGGKNHEYQGIAYSNDSGRSWTKYEANPVLPNNLGLQDFRDPKVFWHDETDRWVMALSANDHIQFWGSTDLINWNHLSDFGRQWGAHGGVWECPDLIRMPVSGSGDDDRWVLIQNLNPGGPQGGSGTQYFVGDFDGETFTLDETFIQDLNEQGALWIDSGSDNYAGVTWSDIPETDGRKLFIGWMSNWEYAQLVPTEPWRSAMTIPRSLTLHETTAGYRVYSQPVRELQALRGDSKTIGPLSVPANESISIMTDFPVSRSELIVEFELPDGETSVGVKLSNTRGEVYRIGYDSIYDRFYSDRTASGDTSFSDKFAGIHLSPRMSRNRMLKMHLFLDVASVELFADDGANVMTETFFPTETFSRLEFFSKGEADVTVNGVIYALNNIWE